MQGFTQLGQKSFMQGFTQLKDRIPIFRIQFMKDFDKK